jgi:thioredoxin
VLVDFHADWCGPCKAMAPAVDQLAARHQGRALVAKVDTDRSPATAQRFAIQAIPTVVVFEGGREARRRAGAMPLGMLEEMLNGRGAARG